MHFHCLGVGAIGSLLAFHLRRRNPFSPITILAERKRLNPGFKPETSTSVVVIKNGVRQRASGFGLQTIDEHARQLSKLPFFYKPQHDPTEADGDGAESRAQEVDAAPHYFHKDHIHALLVTYKAPGVLPRLQQLKERLDQRSTILLLQNGMGVYENLIEKVFVNPLTRPHFIIMSTTHGSYQVSNFFEVEHTGTGRLHYAIVPSPNRSRDLEVTRRQWRISDTAPAESDSIDTQDSAEANQEYSAKTKHSSQRSQGFEIPTENVLSIDAISRAKTIDEDPEYFSLAESLRMLEQCTDLRPTWIRWEDMRIIRRRKLVVNACIGPLTALMECNNGSLFANAHAYAIIKRVCREASALFYGEWEEMRRRRNEKGEQMKRESSEDPEKNEETRAAAEAEAKSKQDFVLYQMQWRNWLSTSSLENEVIKVIRNTPKNHSSMLVDVRNGRFTEIEYINGWLSRLGQTHGLDCPTNESLLRLIRLRFVLPIARKV